MEENLYQVLGVPETATEAEIKKAYKEKVKLTHPDVGGNEDDFKKINNSYQTLSDSNKRKEYDYKRKHGNQSSGGFGRNPHFDDLVNEYVMRMQKQNTALTMQIPLTLKDVLLGGKKNLKFDKKNVCQDCKGTGKEHIEQCPTCQGMGMVSHREHRGNTIFETFGPCYHCQGNGFIASGSNCTKCNGIGHHIEHQDFQIEVPIGIPYGVPVQLPGRGNNNSALNVMFIPDPSDVYERLGDDVAKILEVSYPELLLGAEKVVETIDGTIKTNITKLSKPEDKMRLKGLGLPNYHHHGRGDLFLILRLKEIKELTPAEEKILQSLLEEKNFKV